MDDKRSITAQSQPQPFLWCTKKSKAKGSSECDVPYQFRRGSNGKNKRRRIIFLFLAVKKKEPWQR
eukprot:scaffold2069_cov77-Skeletonema_dohrnii-CCMP3373.AAC.3